MQYEKVKASRLMMKGLRSQDFRASQRILAKSIRYLEVKHRLKAIILLEIPIDAMATRQRHRNLYLDIEKKSEVLGRIL